MVRARTGDAPPRRKRGSVGAAPHEQQAGQSAARSAIHQQSTVKEPGPPREGRRELDLLRTILDHIPVMISCFDAAGQLTYANREWERVIGWTLEQAQQIDILAAVYPDPVVRAAAVDSVQRGEQRWVDFQIRSRDGRVIEAACSRFAHADRSSIEFAVDVTERRHCEKARVELNAQFGTLFKVGPVPLAVSTIADGRIVDVNNRWVELFGYRREEVIGRTEIDLHLLIDPSARARALDIARTNGFLRDFEVQVRLKSGELRDLLVSAVAVDLPDEPATWISTQLDITERKAWMPNGPACWKVR